MKTLPGFLVLFILCAALAGASPAADRGVALVELFTSEGCSSCPPADALLARLAADADRSGRHVYCLSFHVDYWDHLGWKDRFSSAAFTRRQRDYAASLGSESVYTPQMVVNGAKEFVGSNANSAASAIDAALAQPAGSSLQLSATAHGHDVTVRCSVAHAPAGAVLNVAWVDDRAVSAPDRGENDGRTLHHVDVVRDLRTMALTRDYDGTVHLTRPELSDGAVIAWVQARDTGRVWGAGSVRVPRGR